MGAFLKESFPETCKKHVFLRKRKSSHERPFHPVNKYVIPLSKRNRLQKDARRGVIETFKSSRKVQQRLV